MQQLTKKYGLFTAIAMVVGIVIGSGVFFKAEAVLRATGGDMLTGVLAWLFVGLVMLICSYTFSILANRYQKVNGLVDYAETAVGKTYGYYVGWFLSMLYYPGLTSVLAWVSARYLSVLLGFDITGGACLAFAGLFLCGIYALNTLSPILAGRFQVTTTVIKLIPLALMAVGGTVFGLLNGITVQNFTTQLSTQEISAVVSDYVPNASPLFYSVVSVAFAYEGWIIATCINAEIRDSKKNLPRALIIGSLIVVSSYILYYIGIAGGIDKLQLIASGEAGAKAAFSSVFGNLWGTILMVFIVISCLGTLNGLMLACTRGLYALSARGQGPNPRLFRQTDPVTNMPVNASVIGLLLSAIWLVYFYGANLTATWFGPFSFDSSELPIITIYGFYIPIFIRMMVAEKDLSPFKRFVMPALSIGGSLFMIGATILAHGMTCLYYLMVFAVIMALGALFVKPKVAQ